MAVVLALSFLHRVIGLRDHPGFLGPLPLSQQLKSRPFTPVISKVNEDYSKCVARKQLHNAAIWSCIRSLIVGKIAGRSESA